MILTRWLLKLSFASQKNTIKEKHKLATKCQFKQPGHCAISTVYPSQESLHCDAGHARTKWNKSYYITKGSCWPASPTQNTTVGYFARALYHVPLQTLAATDQSHSSSLTGHFVIFQPHPLANNVAMETISVLHYCKKQQWEELCQSRLQMKVALHKRSW